MQAQGLETQEELTFETTRVGLLVDAGGDYVPARVEDVWLLEAPDSVELVETTTNQLEPETLQTLGKQLLRAVDEADE